MASFKVKKDGNSNYTDLSGFVMGLKISNVANYAAEQNAAGDTKVDYINTKREISVTFIPLTDSEMNTLLNNVGFNNAIQYREAGTGSLTTINNCICDSKEIEYYNLTVNRKYKELTLIFKEL